MKKRYQQLVQLRTDLLAESEEILASGDVLTADQIERDNAIHTQIAEIDAELIHFNRLLEAEKKSPVASGEYGRIYSVTDRREDDPMRGFKSEGEFFQAVRAASFNPSEMDERLRIGASATTHTTTEQGFLAPPQMSQEVWEFTHNEDSLLSQVDLEPTSLSSVSKVFDPTTPWGTDAIEARFKDEAAPKVADKVEKPQKELMELLYLYVFVRASDELLQDVPRMNNRLTTKSKMAIDWKINSSFFDGSGAGTPLGWMKSNALVVQAKESGQAAQTVNAKNIAKMYARCLNKQNAVWFINEDVFEQIITMELNGRTIWTPAEAGYQNAPGGRLLGRPVRFSEHCETLGKVGDIQLVDPKGYYAIARSQLPEFAQSLHLYFDKGETAFRWTIRLNGQPHLKTPITPAKGSNTRSHFVALATRS